MKIARSDKGQFKVSETEMKLKKTHTGQQSSSVCFQTRPRPFSLRPENGLSLPD